MATNKYKLTAVELDAALAFIETNGPTNFFPEQFEWKAIRASWTEVRKALQSMDISNYQVSSPYTIFVPKQSLSVRPVQVIEPIDLLIYTALTYRIGLLSEKNRAASTNIFSHRFSKHSSEGFVLDSDWSAFQFEINRRSKSSKFIAITDIVDFFPRIYQHRLSNAIVELTGLGFEAKQVERFLSEWSDGTSYGLPVGPMASNFLSELTLSEVDDFLESEGIDFVRYVDDYAMFGDSYDEMVDCLHTLAQRLHLSQGLSLNLKKTEIITREELRSRDETSTNVDEVRRNELIDVVFDGNPYEIRPYEDLDEEEQALVDAMDLDQQFEDLMAEEVVDAKPVRVILTLMASLRDAALLDTVLANLSRLTPASEAVGRFISQQSDSPDFNQSLLGKDFIEYVKNNPDIRDHQSIWLLEPFIRSTKWNNLSELRQMRRRHGNPWVRRQIALAMGASESRSAVLDLRYDLAGRTSWEWRAMVYACRVLPPDEREAFCKTVRPRGPWTAGNALMKAVVAFASKGSDA